MLIFIFFKLESSVFNSIDDDDDSDFSTSGFGSTNEYGEKPQQKANESSVDPFAVVTLHIQMQLCESSLQ